MVSPRTISAMSSSAIMRVRRSNPIARQLKFWPIPIKASKRVVCVVSGEMGSPVFLGPITLLDEFNKEGHCITSEGIAYVDFPNLRHDIGTGPLTVLTRWRRDRDSGGTNGAMVLPNNSRFELMTLRGGGLGGDTDLQGGTDFTNNTLTTGEWNTIGLSCAGASTTYQGYIDGRLIDTQGNPGSYAGGTTGVRLMTGRDEVSREAQGSMAWAAIWNKVLSRAEHRSVHENHQQMFDISRRLMWIPSVSVAVSPYQYGAYWA